MTDPVQIAAEEFRTGLGRLAAARGETLHRSEQLEIAMNALLRYEVKRLEAKLGSRHPRTERLNARLESGTAIARALEIERQVYRVKVPDVPEGGALVHGRTVDRHGRGIAGLPVGLADATGRPLSTVADATADESGYFAHSLDAELVGRLLETQPEGVFLAVLTPGGQPVYRGRRPLAIDHGARSFTEIPLDRRAVAAANRPGSEEEEEDGDEEKGRVMVPDVLGMSEDEAGRALKKAGLELGDRGTRHAPDSVGKVLEQDPAAESEVPAGTRVDVVLGVAEQESDVEVPRVTGIQLESARKKLSRYGLTLGQVERGGAGEEGLVLEQDPPEGERVPPGTPVSVVVGGGGVT